MKYLVALAGCGALLASCAPPPPHDALGLRQYREHFPVKAMPPQAYPIIVPTRPTLVAPAPVVVPAPAVAPPAPAPVVKPEKWKRTKAFLRRHHFMK